MAAEKKNSKSQFLEIDGDGSQEIVINKLFQREKPKMKPNFQKVEKSHLFAKMDNFLTKMSEANEQLMKCSEEEKKQLCAEEIDDCDRVVELNVMASDDMQDSAVFHVLHAALNGDKNKNPMNAGEKSSLEESSDDDSDSESSEEDSDGESLKNDKERLLKERTKQKLIEEI